MDGGYDAALARIAGSDDLLNMSEAALEQWGEARLKKEMGDVLRSLVLRVEARVQAAQLWPQKSEAEIQKWEEFIIASVRHQLERKAGFYKAPAELMGPPSMS